MTDSVMVENNCSFQKDFQELHTELARIYYTTGDGGM